MDKKEICKSLVNNEVPGELMKYVDLGDEGCKAIAANGMKFVFTNEYLDQAAAKLQPPEPEPKPKPTRKRTTTKRTTTKKAGSK